MKHLDELNELSKIKRVAAPPFLLTRIEERIRQQEEQGTNQFVSLNWLYGAGMAFALLLICNVWLINNFTQTSVGSNQGVSSIVSELNLDQSNHLYNSYE